jgi:hypothetical protein
MSNAAGSFSIFSMSETRARWAMFVEVIDEKRLLRIDGGVEKVILSML